MIDFKYQMRYAADSCHKFFKGVNTVGITIIWDMFTEKIGPELLEDLEEKKEPA